jgi:hypothetical protein
MARETQGVTPKMVMALLAGLWLGWPMQVSAQNAAVTNQGIVPVPLEAKAKETVPSTTKADQAEAEKKEAEPGVTKLLGEKGLEAFYTWIEGAGVFFDPKGVFSIEDGVLRISGESLGYLATRELHSDFRLVAEFKLGQSKTGLGSKKTGSSGLFIHGVGEDKEWMRGFEAQIAAGRMGNVVLHSGAKLTVGTNHLSKAWTEIGKPKPETEARPGEWNTLEMFAAGDKLRVLVNGQQTVEATNLMPNRGKILLQSNGAEIFFRRLDLYPLATMPEVPVQAAAVKPAAQ